MTPVRRWLVLAAVALAVAGCAEPGNQRVSGPLPATAPAATAPPGTAAATDPSGPASPEPSSVGPAPFVGTAEPVRAADLGSSWRSGCPVGPDELNLVRLDYWGFDDRPHVGTLVVHRTVAAEVIRIFQTLYAQRFPIRRMQPVDAFGADDNASMAADNTSGFNCRNAVTTGKPRWSAHAYGRAIDINPVENPYLLGGSVLPPAGAAFVDRSRYRPGMAVPDGTLVRAFTAAGWAWGGRWASTPDYQHFSR